jgi:Spy/CpxP family protein refolding chaperone
MKGLSLGIACFAGVILAGCQSAYYGAAEQFGVHKRDILIDRIEDTQEAQEEAQQQFKDALEQFRAVVDFDGGDLQELYDRLSSEFEKSESAAEEIRGRIDKVEHVAEALFDEWEAELGQYSSASLKRDSQSKLNATRKQYDRLVAVMHRAEKSMDPVLNSFRDQVLYLKHNLNARAIASLKGELGNIQLDINRLIKEMQRSIDESQAFIKTMRSGS